jgi:hypothetical protein
MPAAPPRLLQELVLDGNRMNAALALPLAGTSCTYRFQHPDSSFYECKLLQLQWWRTTNSLRCVCGGKSGGLAWLAFKCLLQRAWPRPETRSTLPTNRQLAAVLCAPCACLTRLPQALL